MLVYQRVSIIFYYDDDFLHFILLYNRDDDDDDDGDGHGDPAPTSLACSLQGAITSSWSFQLIFFGPDMMVPTYPKQWLWIAMKDETWMILSNLLIVIPYGLNYVELRKSALPRLGRMEMLQDFASCLASVLNSWGFLLVSCIFAPHLRDFRVRSFWPRSGWSKRRTQSWKEVQPVVQNFATKVAMVMHGSYSSLDRYIIGISLN